MKERFETANALKSCFSFPEHHVGHLCFEDLFAQWKIHVKMLLLIETDIFAMRASSSVAVQA